MSMTQIYTYGVPLPTPMTQTIEKLSYKTVNVGKNTILWMFYLYFEQKYTI